MGDLVLDSISGAVVSTQLARIEAELFEADWAEARGRRGDGATAAELARTPAQRRADALVEMACRAGTAPADGRRPEPLFTGETVAANWRVACAHHNRRRHRRP